MTPVEAIYAGTRLIAEMQAKQRQLDMLNPGGLFGWSPAATAQRHRLQEDIEALERRLAHLKRIAEGEAL